MIAWPASHDTEDGTDPASARAGSRSPGGAATTEATGASVMSVRPGDPGWPGRSGTASTEVTELTVPNATCVAELPIRYKTPFSD